MVANDIATAEHRKTDGASRSNTGFAVAPVDCIFFQCCPSTLCSGIADPYGSARRCIPLVTMVCLEDLNIVLWAKGFPCEFSQFEEQIDAQAKIWREYDRDFLCGDFDRSSLVAGMTGRPDNERASCTHARACNERGHGRQGKFDGCAGASNRDCGIGRNSDPRSAGSRQRTGVLIQPATRGGSHGTANPEIACIVNAL
jgi:hypothetical protein